jgi:hypothetical protein
MHVNEKNAHARSFCGSKNEQVVHILCSRKCARAEDVSFTTGMGSGAMVSVAMHADMMKHTTRITVQEEGNW